MTELSFTSAYADDTGDKSSGTVVDKAFFEAIEDAINALIHSTANTGITPEDIIDEVVTARGNAADLDTRISGVIDDDGALVAQADLVSTTDAQRLTAAIDLAVNGRTDRWTNGDSSAPDEYTLSGTGAAIIKTGPGESDTEDLDTNHYVAKITYGSAAALLTQVVIASTVFSEHHDLRGRKVSAVVRAKSSAANQARLVIDDGVNQTASSFHAGDASVEKLTATHTIAATATKLDVYFEVAVSGAAYFTKLSVAFTDIGLEDWIPFGSEATEDHPGYVTTKTQRFDGPKHFKEVPTFDPGSSNPTGAEALVSGVIEVDTTVVGNVGVGDDTLWTYTLPANVLDHDGAALRIKAFGINAGNTNAKTTKFVFGGESAITVQSTSTATTIKWDAEILIFRTGTGAQRLRYVGRNASGSQLTSFQNDSPTAAQDETGTIALTLTGSGTSNNDVVIHGVMVEILN